MSAGAGRSPEEKKALLKELLAKRGGATGAATSAPTPASGPAKGDFDNYTYDMFLSGAGPTMVEADSFGDWVEAAVAKA